MDNWIGNTVGIPNQTYKPVPVFHSTKGYSVFDNSTYRLRADIGIADSQQYRLTQQGPVFDYYFWMEPPTDALQSYTDLTGKPILPPKWAFEPWMGRTWAGLEEYAVARPRGRGRKRDKTIFAIGYSAFGHLFGRLRGPRFACFKSVHGRRHGIKVLSWYYPAIPESKTKIPHAGTYHKPASRF